MRNRNFLRHYLVNGISARKSCREIQEQQVFATVEMSQFFQPSYSLVPSPISNIFTGICKKN